MDDLQALADILTALSENPYDIYLHIRHIALAERTGNEQAVEAREMMAAYWAVGNEVWVPLIEAKALSTNMASISGALAIHDLYERAEGDYLCA